MGHADEKRERASNRRAAKAEKANGRGLGGLFSNKGVDGLADWGNASPEKIVAVITTMQALGGAVTFGLSRDGNAHMLTFLLDGSRETVWINPDIDLDVALLEVLEKLDTLL